ncbi:hypothetical protein GGTG_07814 [Gaeumannomyces tritici R3-111a-1]|uniref:Uncharacterized protein n=1 Tax=Gaeumannomyces tritici (strain R3-111a-1) TaxID=644352 RepID=J3P2S0_GAET3|nr:hypothetical protein GGTG_07814 [Gaeumannomyces tritici R3-111a-1]EJT73962.1 hypothetical protein GGTG_07814 [Gaeumannomyces tritici R3-111a-1]
MAIKELEVSDGDSGSPDMAEASPTTSHLNTSSDGGSSHTSHRLEDGPACIVGMACRLPGGIRSPSDL